MALPKTDKVSDSEWEVSFADKPDVTVHLKMSREQAERVAAEWNKNLSHFPEPLSVADAVMYELMGLTAFDDIRQEG